jgi:hypothetical protein
VTHEAPGELTFNERMHLSVCYFGYYTFPMADKVDAWCAMENAKVPYKPSQLNDAQRAILEKFKEKK